MITKRALRGILIDDSFSSCCNALERFLARAIYHATLQLGYNDTNKKPAHFACFRNGFNNRVMFLGSATKKSLVYVKVNRAISFFIASKYCNDSRS